MMEMMMQVLGKTRFIVVVVVLAALMKVVMRKTVVIIRVRSLMPSLLINGQRVIASPSFGFRRIGSSAIHSSFDDHSKSSSDLDGKSPLMCDQVRTHRKEDLNRILRAQSLLPTGEASFNKQLTGELPISHGCRFIQTVFNGVNVLDGVGLLSTPYTVKEGGWAS